MATDLQYKAVKRIVEIRRNPKRNKISKGKILIDVGYSRATAIKPSQVLESKGFKEVLKEYGLTDGLITKALVEDIKGKPKKRIMELNLGAEILGMKKNITNNINIGIFQPNEEEKQKINDLLNGE